MRSITITGQAITATNRSTLTHTTRREPVRAMTPGGCDNIIDSYGAVNK
jgi:hypothetical protein